MDYYYKKDNLEELIELVMQIKNKEISQDCDVHELIQDKYTRKELSEIFEKYQDDKKLITVDALTNVLNRRGFDYMLKRIESKFFDYNNSIKRIEEDYEKRRLIEKPTPASILFFDLNDLRVVNKEGHHKGDEMLKEFAAIIKSNVRDMDIVARYGGDEFAAALDSPYVESIRKTCDIVKQAYENKISVSAGVSFYNGKRPIFNVVIDADKIMMSSKERYKRDNKPWVGYMQPESKKIEYTNPLKEFRLV